MGIPTSLLVFGAFLLGSIPTGFIIGRLYGKDLRELGSGNIGATNANRVLGKRAGLLTLIGDVIKGVAAVSLAYFSLDTWALVPALLGVAAVLGHCFSPFLRFRGGKGVATGLGVSLMLAPGSTLLAVGVFILVLMTTNYVSLGSILSALALPLLMFLGIPREAPTETIIAAAIIAAIIIQRHKRNISRLRSGNEMPWRSR